MGMLRNTRQVSRSIIHLDTPQTSLDGMHQHFCIAIGSTESAFGVSNSPFVSTTPTFATLPPAHRSTGDSFSFTSAPAFDHSPTPFGVTSRQAFGRNPFVAQSPLFVGRNVMCRVLLLSVYRMLLLDSSFLAEGSSNMMQQGHT